MEVWADDPAGVVLWAGGLICDHALDGWGVVVRLPTLAADRALEILGAVVHRQEDRPRPAEPGLPMVSISAACDAPDRAAPVASYLGGPGFPTCSAFADNGFRHRLSAGARAFKAHALRASGLSADVAPIEVFRPAMAMPLAVVRGRIDRWPNAGQCNDASNTPETCC